jgi:glycogen synthase
MSEYAFLVGAQTEGLKYTGNDLDLVEKALSMHGYTIIRPVGDKYEVLRELEKACRLPKQSDTFIFYFSGHGNVEGGSLYLKYLDDTDINMTIVFSELRRCFAGSRLAIIDACSSGTARNEWAVKIDEDNYCLLTATKQFEPTKEIEKYKASFLSYHIHKALTEEFPTNQQKQITVRTLINYLEESQATYNLKERPLSIAMPHLYGGNNMVIATLSEENYEAGSARIYSDNVKNVCFISSEYPPNIVGGLGVHVSELSLALANAGVNVEILLPYLNSRYGYQSDSINNLKITSLSEKSEASYGDSYSWIRFAYHVYKHFDGLTQKPDIIHCHDWATVLAGIAVKWKYKIPLVFHLHLPNKKEFCSSVENLGLLCADMITVNSECIRSDLQQLFPNENLNIKVIPNGINRKKFYPAEKTTPAEKEYILFVGRLVGQKGVEYLIRAFYYVCQVYENIYLRIVGEGELEDTLRQLCINYMIEEKVVFEGFKTDIDLTKLYQGCLFAVVPSVYEPFGMAAIEAMACKKPVVASDIMGLRENIRHGSNGFLFTSEDHLDLAQWMLTLLSDNNLRESMGNEGLNYVTGNNLTWDKISQQYIELYNRLDVSKPDLTIKPAMNGFGDQIFRLATRDNTNENFIKNLFDWLK